MPSPPPSSLRWLALVGAVWLAACAPEIGDDCETALDCSASGSRLCDRTQPGGYCIIQGCERGTCPEESVCVKFRPESERNAITFCMRKCNDHGDCRDDEGYRCLGAQGFGLAALDAGMSEDPSLVIDDAEILGDRGVRFCALPPSVLLPDIEESEPDEDAGPLMSVMPDDDAGS